MELDWLLERMRIGRGVGTGLKGGVGGRMRIGKSEAIEPDMRSARNLVAGTGFPGNRKHGRWHVPGTCPCPASNAAPSDN
jgi:hypothetical protein